MPEARETRYPGITERVSSHGRIADASLFVEASTVVGDCNVRPSLRGGLDPDSTCFVISWRTDFKEKRGLGVPVLIKINTGDNEWHPILLVLKDTLENVLGR